MNKWIKVTMIAWTAVCALIAIFSALDIASKARTYQYIHFSFPIIPTLALWIIPMVVLIIIGLATRPHHETHGAPPNT